MREYSRRLNVTISGRWYLGLTILIGVTAITTGNNAIYVMESLLLSGLILSGILSEQMIISVDVEVDRGPAVAKSEFITGDHVVITNRKNRHIFCIEVGEWIDSKFVPISWIAHLKPKETVTLKSKRVYPHRGIHHWNALAVATQYPFGFARKLRFENPPGSRIVWPAQLEHRQRLDLLGIQKRRQSLGTTPQQGEVRPMEIDDDFRLIVWTLSNKGTEPVVRTRKGENQAPEVILDLRCPSDSEFEKRVQLAAFPFYLMQESQSGSLTIVSSQGKRKLFGKNPILSELAILQPELTGAIES